MRKRARTRKAAEGARQEKREGREERERAAQAVLRLFLSVDDCFELLEDILLKLR